MPTYKFKVNGEEVSVDAPPDEPLLWVLREQLGVTGPKYGCGLDVCKACTSLLDGQHAVNPCVIRVQDMVGHEITTIEGLAQGSELHPVQEVWLDLDVPQCGYCQPGQIMSTVALLMKHPDPTDEQIDEIENVCRCGTYPRIRDAIRESAIRVRRG